MTAARKSIFEIEIMEACLQEDKNKARDDIVITLKKSLQWSLSLESLTPPPLKKAAVSAQRWRGTAGPTGSSRPG